MRILVTGASGFIGYHVVSRLLKTTDYEFVAMDRLSHAGSWQRWDYIEIDPKRMTWLWHDLRSPVSDLLDKRIGEIDAIFHLAASTHVDRSITDPVSFVMDNVLGTTHILDYARKKKDLQKFFYFSTDEVFGSAPAGSFFGEWARYKSGNPYSASKSGGEEMAVAFENTYGVPVIITHCMNVFGEKQHPEKYLPLLVKASLTGEKVYVHADKDRVRPGQRTYLHARTVAEALNLLLEKGKAGEKYNIVGEREVDNLALAGMVGEITGKPIICELVDFHSSRPGHDLRYALSDTNLKGLGFKPTLYFAEALEQTVRWMMEHPSWLAL